MLLHINDPARILEIWLNRQEQEDTAFRESLEPLLTKYRAKKYLPVFFLSGSGNLQEYTAELLRSCRKRMDDPPIRQPKCS